MEHSPRAALGLISQAGCVSARSGSFYPLPSEANPMNLKMAIKLIVLGLMIVVVGNLLHGHDILTAVALALLFLLVALKITFALIAQRRGGFPPANGGPD